MRAVDHVLMGEIQRTTRVGEMEMSFNESRCVPAAGYIAWLILRWQPASLPMGGTWAANLAVLLIF